MSETNVEALNALCEKLGGTSNADTNLEALKNIYNALSGKTSNADLIVTAIGDITTVAKKPVAVEWIENTVSTEVTSVNIPNGVTRIGSQAFKDYTSLTSITIPDSVTSIAGYAFENCSSLTSITLGNGVTDIANYAFYSCTSLASITIPDSVTFIDDMAFSECTSLANIYYKGTEEQWNAITKRIDWDLNMGSNVEGGTVITYNYTG